MELMKDSEKTESEIGGCYDGYVVIGGWSRARSTVGIFSETGAGATPAGYLELIGGRPLFF
jgi:hypothetical protein